MNKSYYIAQIGDMWVKQYYSNIGSVSLGEDKNYASHLSEDHALLLQQKTGAKLILVNVNITETEMLTSNGDTNERN